MTLEGSGSFSTKEIVLEIRNDVKELTKRLERIDREGSIGTKAQLADHENRLRENSQLIQRLQDSQVTRSDVHQLRNDIAAINIGLADRPEQIRQFREVQEELDILRAAVESLNSWRSSLRLIWALVIVILTLLATVSWHIWG